MRYILKMCGFSAIIGLLSSVLLFLHNPDLRIELDNLSKHDKINEKSYHQVETNILKKFINKGVIPSDKQLKWEVEKGYFMATKEGRKYWRMRLNDIKSIIYSDVLEGNYSETFKKKIYLRYKRYT